MIRQGAYIAERSSRQKKQLKTCVGERCFDWQTNFMSVNGTGPRSGVFVDHNIRSTYFLPALIVSNNDATVNLSTNETYLHEELLAGRDRNKHAHLKQKVTIGA
jgi:hypothetical protein